MMDPEQEKRFRQWRQQQAITNYLVFLSVALCITIIIATIIK